MTTWWWCGRGRRKHTQEKSRTWKISSCKEKTGLFGHTVFAMCGIIYTLYFSYSLHQPYDVGTVISHTLQNETLRLCPLSSHSQRYLLHTVKIIIIIICPSLNHFLNLVPTFKHQIFQNDNIMKKKKVFLSLFCHFLSFSFHFFSFHFSVFFSPHPLSTCHLLIC